MPQSKDEKRRKALARLIDENGYIIPGKELEAQALKRKGVTTELKYHHGTWLELQVESYWKSGEYDEAYRLAQLAQGSERQNEYVKLALDKKFIP